MGLVVAKCRSLIEIKFLKKTGFLPPFSACPNVLRCNRDKKAPTYPGVLRTPFILSAMAFETENVRS